MGVTWGISGPVFLVLYVLLLVAAASLGPLLLAAAGRRVSRRWGDGPAPDVGVEELAYLAGGPARLVATAIARLVEGGVLRVSRDRHLAATGRAPLGDLDATVVATVEARTAPTVGHVIGTVRYSPAVRAIEQAVQQRGLMLDPADLRRRKMWGLLAIGAVVVLGIARVAAAIARGAPVTFLILLIVVAMVVGFVQLFLSVNRPTRRGVATLAAARAAAPAPVPSGRVGGPVLAGAIGATALVALGGLAMYPDPELADLLAMRSAGGGSWDGGWDGGSSCGGSSCGGSSCGGSSSSCGGGGGCGGGCGGGS